MINILIGTTLVIYYYLLTSNIKEETRKVSDAQLSLLVSSSADLIKQKRFRELIENLGNQKQAISLAIMQNNEPVFKFPSSSKAYKACSNQALSFKNNMKIDKFNVELCRGMNISYRPFYLLLIFFIFISFISLYLITKLERKSVVSLSEAIGNLGLETRKTNSIIQLLSDLSQISEQIEEARENQIELIKKETILKRNDTFLHDFIPALEAVKSIKFNVDDETTILVDKALKRMEFLAESIKLNQANPAEHLIKKGTKLNIGELFKFLISEKKHRWNEFKTEISIKNSLSNKINFFPFDVIEFDRVFGNLIDNAIEASDGIAKLVLKLSESDNTFLISIIDNGKGIKNEDVQKVFNDGFTSGKEKGTGHGLFIVSEIIQSWGGNVWVLETSSRGTTINVQFPKPDGTN